MAPIKADELMAQLEADPQFVAERARRNAERQAQQDDWRREEAPLVLELNATGIAVESAWDLVNTSTAYPQALPILLEHLQRPYPDRVREGIARALAVKPARFAWDTLARLYRAETGTDTKDGLAVALCAIADDSVMDELIGLLRDRSLGPSRVLLVDSLERWNDPQAQTVLESLEPDPELTVQVRLALSARSRKHSRRKRT
jgi:hypothetical protein